MAGPDGRLELPLAEHDDESPRLGRQRVPAIKSDDCGKTVRLFVIVRIPRSVRLHGSHRNAARRHYCQ
jgi:hypothetical protein